MSFFILLFLFVWTVWLHIAFLKRNIVYKTTYITTQFFLCLSIYLFIYVYIYLYLFIYLSIYLSIYLYIYLSQSIYLSLKKYKGETTTYPDACPQLTLPLDLPWNWEHHLEGRGQVISITGASIFTAHLRVCEFILISCVVSEGQGGHAD